MKLWLDTYFEQRDSTRCHGQLVSKRTNRGFTLVEMLITLTIGSLLVVSVVGATRALSVSRQNVDLRIERVSAARHAIEAIVAELRNVRRDRERTRMGLKPLITGKRGDTEESGDKIDMLVISNRRCRPEGAESDQYEAGFFLMKQPGQPLPVLMFRKDHALDEHPDDGGIATVVAEGIVGLTFEYFSEGEWLGEWPAHDPRAPKAVRITVVAASGNPQDTKKTPDAVTLSTIVPIRVTQPLGNQSEGGA